MSSNPRINCGACSRRILAHAYRLCCTACQQVYHLKCISFLSKHDSVYVNRDTVPWICVNCTSSIFPFNHMYDDDEFYQSLKDEFESDDLNDCNKWFNMFDLSENTVSPLYDLDPDINYYQSVSALMGSDCKYFLENDFNLELEKREITDNNFSIIHINIRSLPRNLDVLRHYLSTLRVKFKIIAISESWLNANNSELYGLEDYNLISNFRSNRRGGGVSLFIHKSITYNIVSSLTISDVHIESLFIEINKTTVCKNNNVYVGVIYRPPSSDVNKFNESLRNLCDLVKPRDKNVYIAGDFNIDLLNHEHHLHTSEFIDHIYSYSLLSHDLPELLTIHQPS